MTKQESINTGMDRLAEIVERARRITYDRPEYARTAGRRVLAACRAVDRLTHSRAGMVCWNVQLAHTVLVTRRGATTF